MKFVVLVFITSVTWSRPARGAWVEIFDNYCFLPDHGLSRPARGAWVEMAVVGRQVELGGRAPQGARGLKYGSESKGIKEERRAPQGARGLKFPADRMSHQEKSVAPRKGRVG